MRSTFFSILLALYSLSCFAEDSTEPTIFRGQVLVSVVEIKVTESCVQAMARSASQIKLTEKGCRELFEGTVGRENKTLSRSSRRNVLKSGNVFVALRVSEGGEVFWDMIFQENLLPSEKDVLQKFLQGAGR